MAQNDIISKLSNYVFIDTKEIKAVDKKFKVPRMKLVMTENVENKEEEDNKSGVVLNSPLSDVISRDADESNMQKISLVMNNYYVEQYEYKCNEIFEKDEDIINFILDKVFEKINSVISEDIIDLTELTNSRELVVRILKEDNELNYKYKGFAKEPFLISDKNTVDEIITTSKPKIKVLSYNDFNFMNYNIYVNTDLNREIILGRGQGELGGLTLCIDKDDFISYKGSKTIIKFGLDFTGEGTEGLYRKMIL